MPKYLITGDYTVEGIKGVLAEGGSGRVNAVRSLIESLGGTLESMHFAFGENTFYITADMPSNTAAAAASLVATAAGGAKVRTVVLLTPAEVDAATKLSPTYRPPGG